VKETVEHLSRTIEQFHSFRVKENESELAKLREELEETMQVARRAEERVAALDDERAYNEQDYE
jgi:cob(I)alamin adenosyltransferase